VVKEQTWRLLLENKVDYPHGKPFTAIIGLSPSQGARSPRLWNRAYKAIGEEGEMLAFDVSSKNLLALMNALSEEPYYKGGAVTMPYKENIAKWLGESYLEPVVVPIGAVNVLYRNFNNFLIGGNTDGEAAVESLINHTGPINSKKCVILGGVGKAVAAYMVKAGARVEAFVRSPQKNEKFCQSLRIDVKIWPLNIEKTSDIDVLINCTNVGFAQTCPGEMPVEHEVLNALKENVTVFDVIYDPRPTLLLQEADKIGLKTLDGLEMNKMQAVMAFNKVFPLLERSVVVSAMSDV